MLHLLDTYDPEWEARWETANARCEALLATPGTEQRLTVAQRAARTAEMKAVARTLQDAFDAQFRTVDDYRDHWLKWFPVSHGREQPATAIPDGLTLPDLRTHLARLSASAPIALRQRDCPAPQDPPGLAPFRSPQPADVERYVEHIELHIPGYLEPARCLLAVETTPCAAHLCFIWVKDGASVCDHIEALATHVYRERLRMQRGWRSLLGLRVPGQYRPRDVAIYEYDPIGASEWSNDGVDQVVMHWDRHVGFVDPHWRIYPSVPVWLAEVADDPPALRCLPRRLVLDAPGRSTR